MPPARTHRHRAVGVAAVVALGLATAALAGCGEDDEGPEALVEPTTSITTGASDTTTSTRPVDTTSPTLPEAPNQVRIVDYDFTPATVEVPVGATVTWVNDDTVDHWVLSRGSDDIDSATLRPGSSYADTFTEAGTYDYFCNIHNVMTGTVVVR